MPSLTAALRPRRQPLQERLACLGIGVRRNAHPCPGPTAG